MENLQFILKENGEIGEAFCNKSTLGFTFEANGHLVGNYVVIDKPSVTVQDVMEALKELCPMIEQCLSIVK